MPSEQFSAKVYHVFMMSDESNLFFNEIIMHALY